LLRDPRRATPLALDLAAIDRTLVIEGAAAPVPPGEMLRVLMVIARPSGLKDVGYQMVARPLVERLSAVRGQVALDVLRPPTLDAMHEALGAATDAGEPYHILHFDGHGAFREVSEKEAKEAPELSEEGSHAWYLSQSHRGLQHYQSGQIEKAAEIFSIF